MTLRPTCKNMSALFVYRLFLFSIINLRLPVTYSLRPFQVLHPDNGRHCRCCLNRTVCPSWHTQQQLCISRLGSWQNWMLVGTLCTEKNLGFNRWESVKLFIQGLGRLDLTHIYMLRKCKWLCSNRRCANPVFNNLLWVSLSEYNDVNKFTTFMFMSQHEIRQRVSENFALYCLNWFLCV